MDRIEAVLPRKRDAVVVWLSAFAFAFFLWQDYFNFSENNDQCIHTYTCTHVCNIPLMYITTLPFSQIGSSGNEE